MTKVFNYLLILSLSFTNWTYGQDENTEIPKKIQKSISELSVFLTKNESSEFDKVERIYEWITKNIEYDYDKLTSSKTFVGTNPESILKSKKGISSDYAELMNAMLEEIGIKSETIPGYTHDIHWQAGDTLFEEGHTWIAIQIDEEWFLADPTWDAGYIGRLPIKPFKPKVYKDKELKPEKAEKIIKKREEKEAKRKEAYDKKPQYTDKHGFVSDPGKDFFLIHSDSFLLSHLPTNPIWQLRNNPISIEDFSNEDSVIIQIIESKGHDSLDNQMDLISYQELDYLQKLLVLGEAGNTFNPKNPSVKAMYYFNFLELITRKDLQKVARGSIYEIDPSKYRALSALNDTLIKYISLNKKFQKILYKKNKEFDVADFKLSKERDKLNGKAIDQLERKSDKFESVLSSNSAKLQDQLEKLETMYLKLRSDYPSAIDYKKPDDLDLEHIQKWIDSIQIQQKFIKNGKDQLTNLRNNSSLNRYFYNLNYLDYLYNANQNFIPYNNYSTSSVISEVDSLIAVQSDLAMTILIDSLELELFDKALFDAVKKIEMFTKAAKTELKLMETSNEIKYPAKYETYLNALLEEQIREVKQLVLNSGNFNLQIAKSFSQTQGFLRSLVKKKDKQVELKQAKYDFNLELTEKQKDRSDDLIEIMTTKSKAWKNKYKS